MTKATNTPSATPGTTPSTAAPAAPAAKTNAKTGGLYVRVQPKTVESFFRCGMRFSRAWQRVGVDKATALRLQDEQMLEVSTEVPADYVAPEPAEAAQAE